MRWHGKDVILYAFDLIELDGRDMRRVPIEERKATLAKLLRWASDGVAFNEHYSGDDAIIYRSLPRPSGVDGLCVDGPTRSLVVLRSDYRNFVELLAPGAQPWQPRDPEPLPDSDFDPTESGVPWRTMPIKPAIRRVYQGAVVPEGGEAREVPGNERFRARLHHGGK